MEFKKFTEKTAEGIKYFLGEVAEINIREIQKNNGVLMHGITILEKGSNLSPTIYLDGLYLEYLKGKTMGSVIKDIIEIYEKAKVKGRVNMDFFQDYEKVKSHIFCKLINYEKNKELLQELPWRKFFDLAIVCYYVYTNDLIGNGSITIRREHLELWGIKEEELLEEALNNTRHSLPYCWYDMKDMIKEMWESEKGQLSLEEARLLQDIFRHRRDAEPMYVLTNFAKMYGAINMVYEDVLEEMGNMIGCNYVVLPSSIHEIILVPGDTPNAEKLRFMVNDVNSTQVSPQEVLSDHVYFYDRNRRKLSMM
ncbi:MAG: hypothetical protein E7293_01130 [Lachnospiraceae bacterium]|nr:hypothetical protein [Lachnospiraceae bacterium]